MPAVFGQWGKRFRISKFEPDRYPLKECKHNNDVKDFLGFICKQKYVFQRWSYSQKSFKIIFCPIGWLYQGLVRIEHQGHSSDPVVHGSRCRCSFFFWDHLRDLWTANRITNKCQMMQIESMNPASFICLSAFQLTSCNLNESGANSNNMQLEMACSCLFGIDKKAISASHFVVQIQWFPHGHYTI